MKFLIILALTLATNVPARPLQPNSGLLLEKNTDVGDLKADYSGDKGPVDLKADYRRNEGFGGLKTDYRGNEEFEGLKADYRRSENVGNGDLGDLQADY
ncbi:hypothetical protein DM02DRAFT_661798 [Periconia macrospinosa]|uniref:Uncharacterized protein n=1 Tax=Periconia macrospinosa TaxID=97972 RepID=A0A2V1D7N8_9PLEO|nr:hypothetical protein DM02DRAFT_661798 [Periconia macrospinosa]